MPIENNAHRFDPDTGVCMDCGYAMVRYEPNETHVEGEEGFVLRAITMYAPKQQGNESDGICTIAYFRWDGKPFWIAVPPMETRDNIFGLEEELVRASVRRIMRFREVAR